MSDPIPLSQSLAQRAQWADLRHSVRQRLGITGTGEASRAQQTPLRSARDHPRWNELIGYQAAPEQQSQSAAEQVREAEHGHEPTSRAMLGPNYVVEETTIRNDYSQYFVDTGAGQLPGNAVRNPEHASRFDEYPKLKRLVTLKDALLSEVSHPPTYLAADLRASLQPQSALVGPDDFHLNSLLPIKYDVILIDPPLETYEWEGIPNGGHEESRCWSWKDVASLPIPTIAAKESFIFLWVGSGSAEGLERGREVLMKWGYRRCEDIVWVRTNHTEPDLTQGSTSSAFARSVHHCLMGIRGTVRRSTDTSFIHANIDTDVILWEGETIEVPRVGAEETTTRLFDPRAKPPEMMSLIENFCLGTRRLELFGRNRNLRRGWLTIGQGELGPGTSHWDQALRGDNSCAASVAPRNPFGGVDAQRPRRYVKAEYDSYFGIDKQGCDLRDRKNLVPFSEEIDAIRPKTPPPGPAPGHNGGGGGGSSYGGKAPGGGGGGGVGVPQRPKGRRAPHSLPGGVPRDAASSAGFEGAPQILGGYDVATPPGGTQARFGLIQPASPGSGVRTDQSAGNPSSQSGGGSGGGAGLSGLGAGGPRTVSKPSGSEVLSGMQAQSALGLSPGPGARGEMLGAPSGLGRGGARRRS